MSAMYAVYHGPAGLRHIGTRTHHATVILAKGRHIISVATRVWDTTEYLMIFSTNLQLVRFVMLHSVLQLTHNMVDGYAP